MQFKNAMLVTAASLASTVSANGSPAQSWTTMTPSNTYKCGATDHSSSFGIAVQPISSGSSKAKRDMISQIGDGQIQAATATQPAGGNSKPTPATQGTQGTPATSVPGASGKTVTLGTTQTQGAPGTQGTPATSAPGAPGKTVTLGTTQTHGTPATPATPATQGTPATPATGTAQGTPATPATQGTAQGTPATPATQGTPATPATGTAQGTPATPATPATQGTPATPATGTAQGAKTESTAGVAKTTTVPGGVSPKTNQVTKTAHANTTVVHSTTVTPSVTVGNHSAAATPQTITTAVTAPCENGQCAPNGSQAPAAHTPGAPGQGGSVSVIPGTTQPGTCIPGTTVPGKTVTLGASPASPAPGAPGAPGTPATSAPGAQGTPASPAPGAPGSAPGAQGTPATSAPGAQGASGTAQAAHGTETAPGAQGTPASPAASAPGASSTPNNNGNFSNTSSCNGENCNESGKPSTVVGISQITDGQIQQQKVAVQSKIGSTTVLNPSAASEAPATSSSNPSGACPTGAPSLAGQSCKNEGSLSANLKNGVLTDSKGRVGSIVANHQFQFDGPPPQAGAIYAAGWSITPEGNLALGDNDVFYQCLSGNFYNLYDKSIGSQCQPIHLEAVDLIDC
ncbi:hypothetical protein ZYGM_002342 [Zygosaccharomyces mellis]|uniref:Cell wall mannoprotein PIR1-like C-terminal domain-containing protein n=1 Tax=Zygosaccharomyces mellis TaxID=42258 RepID=A0A4C2DYV4_9SACH|nr:hypothetical protein ZYGM_002342 [Zygosaccharomyces mellis]